MTEPKRKRAAIYARISQADVGVDKTDNQEKELRAIADASGYDVVAVFVDDDISAFEGKNERPGFVSLVAGTRDGRFDVVMATEPQRFTRGSASELEALQVACVKAGAVLHTRAAGIQDPATPMIRAMLQFQDTLAWLEVAVGRDRQKARNRADRAEGIPNKGLRPFGFEKDRVTVRESEAVHIREGYRLILEEGVSVWKLAQTWTALGLKTDGMGKMRKTRADREATLVPAVWTTTTMRQLLIRPRNAGLLIHEGAEIPNSQIQPIVSREQWTALVSHIRGVNTLKGPKPQYLLGGIIECICGQTMHASKSVSGRKGQKREYKIYRCRLYGMDKNVKHVTIQLLIADSVVRDWVVEDIGLGLCKEGDAPRDDLVAVQARLAEVAAEESRATDMVMEGLGNAAQIKGRLKVLKEERGHLEEERDAILSESAHGAALAEFRNTIRDLPDEAGDEDVDAAFVKGFAAWDSLTMDARRAIIRGGYRVRITEGGRGAERVKVVPR